MKITKEFVTYEQSIALKELGFDEACICYYDVEDSYKLKPTPMKEEINAFHFNSKSIMTAAPLKQQVFRWFREKHNLVSWVYISHNEFFYTIVENGRYVKGVGSHANYDEAEDACLNKLIEIVKNK